MLAHLVREVEGGDHLDELLGDEGPRRLVLLLPVLWLLQLHHVVLGRKTLLKFSLSLEKDIEIINGTRYLTKLNHL